MVYNFDSIYVGSLSFYVIHCIFQLKLGALTVAIDFLKSRDNFNKTPLHC